MKTFLEAKTSKEFVLSAELPLRPEMSADDVVRDGKMLSEHADGILLTDNQYGQTHMSTAIAASLLLANGVDPIVQLSCRNRNRIALLSELLGMRALDVSSVMLIQGNRIPKEYKPRPRSVMDMDAKELIATARMINEDEKIAGRFLVIASGTIHDPEPGWKPEELMAKADSGAQLIFTQLCLNIDLLKRYMTHLVEQRFIHQASVVVSLAAIPNADAARWLRDNRRRALIPVPIIKRLEQASDPEAEGVAICAELIQQYAEIPGVSGVNLMTPGSLKTIGAAVAASGVNG